MNGQLELMSLYWHRSYKEHMRHGSFLRVNSRGMQENHKVEVNLSTQGHVIRD